MFIFITILFFATLNIFSAENLVSVILGVVATTGLTQWVKNSAGLQGLGAMWLSIILSFVVACVAVVVSMFFTEGGFTIEKLTASSVQIWAFAQVAYKQLLADK